MLANFFLQTFVPLRLHAKEDFTRNPPVCPVNPEEIQNCFQSRTFGGATEKQVPGDGSNPAIHHQLVAFLE
jgi:hypothetical protein